MLKAIFFASILSSAHSQANNQANDTDTSWRELTEADLPVPDLVKSRGYDCEIHKVTTEDNYILTVHRVMNPKKRRRSKKAVLLYHGFFDSSDIWVGIDTKGDYGDGHVTEEVDRELAFALARRGYDVWLANWRGNKYSTEHVFLNTSDPKYWDFTLDPIFGEDIYATVSYVLNTTKRSIPAFPSYMYSLMSYHAERIAYIGHSEGCTAGMILMSKHPKMAATLKPFIALGPYFGNRIARYFKMFSPPLARNPLYRFLADEPRSFLNLPRMQFCALPVIKMACLLFAWVSQGYTGQHALTEKTYNSFTFYGTSTIAISHNVQIFISGELRYYRYDDNERNEKLYGSSEPPFYHLANSTNQYLAIFYSHADVTAAADKIEQFMDEYQGRIVFKRKITSPDFNHLSFAEANDVDFYVNKKVIDLLNKYAE
ncbi:Lysosomal acid lipase/cholesteryl ester hydrolase [Halotydeus destructor]|nr:Lysosomal acid lipase/cholesteryl ester hydrolase [Halotydeus destructor]